MWVSIFLYRFIDFEVFVNYLIMVEFKVFLFVSTYPIKIDMMVVIYLFVLNHNTVYYKGEREKERSNLIIF